MGENRLLLVIALGGMALTLGMCTMSGAGTATGSSTFNGCMGHTHKFEVDTVGAFDIRLYLTPLGQARQFIETCGT